LFARYLATTLRPGLTLLAAFLWMFCAWSPAPARADWSSYIYVHSGPDGEIQISTPWGDYAAYDEGNGNYWVGTQREFDRQRVIGIERASGFRLSTVNTAGADASFVPEGTLRARIGRIDVDGLSPSIMFGAQIIDEHNRPVADMRTVDFSWIQVEGTVPTGLVVYSPHDRLRYLGHSEAAGQGWYHETLDVYRKDLIRPVALILVVPHARPGVIGIRSIAAIDYDVATKSEASDAALGVAQSSNQVHHIQYLRMLDPSLVAKPASPLPQVRVGSVPVPTATRAEVADSGQPQSYEYDGPVSDDVHGKGHMRITFLKNADGTIANGRWTMGFPDGTSAGGDVTGITRILANRINFGLMASGCGAYAVTASILDDGRIDGRYAGYEGFQQCRNGGRFTISRVAEPQAAASANSAATPAAPQRNDSKLAVFVVHAPKADITLEVAQTEVERERGLMDRRVILAHNGMIFVFDRDERVSFWMKDTFVPLDMIFVAADGTVRSVFSNAAVVLSGTPDQQIPREAGQAKYVIELPAGEASRDGIVPGITLDLHDVPPPQ
jgi:uncharacterized protein